MMCFGKCTEIGVKYNGVLVEHVNEYKYRGNILILVRKENQHVFGNNCEFLCNPSYNAIYCFRKKVKYIGVLPPKITFYIFDTLVRLILTYGNDVWGIGKKRLTQVDKVFLQFARCVLHAKFTTCNTIVYGKCGRFPSSIRCQINTPCFLKCIKELSFITCIWRIAQIGRSRVPKLDK